MGKKDHANIIIFEKNHKIWLYVNILQWSFYIWVKYCCCSLSRWNLCYIAAPSLHLFRPQRLTLNICFTQITTVWTGVFFPPFRIFFLWFLAEGNTAFSQLWAHKCKGSNSPTLHQSTLTIQCIELEDVNTCGRVSLKACPRICCLDGDAYFEAALMMRVGSVFRFTHWMLWSPSIPMYCIIGAVTSGPIFSLQTLKIIPFPSHKVRHGVLSYESDKTWAEKEIRRAMSLLTDNTKWQSLAHCIAQEMQN